LITPISIFNNHKWWKSNIKVQNSKQNRKDIVSSYSEDNIVNLLRDHNPSWIVKKRIRIPRPGTKRSKGEVDVICITNHTIFLIEVKNYLGKVSLNEQGHIIQNGEKRTKAFDIIQEKLDNFSLLMISKSNDDPPEMKSILVFDNKKIIIDDSFINYKNYCLTKDLIKKIEYMERDLTEMKNSNMKLATELLDLFGTWDKLIWKGGKEVYGDIIDDSYLLTLIDRNTCSVIYVSNENNYIKTLFFGPKLIFLIKKWSGEEVVHPFERGLEIIFRVPGHASKNNSILLEEIQSLKFGHKEIPKWRSKKNFVKNSNYESKKFLVGTQHKGQIITWLPKGGILVSIGENMKGILNEKDFFSPGISNDFIKQIYSKGKIINVKITRNNKGKINLKYVED